MNYKTFIYIYIFLSTIYTISYITTISKFCKGRGRVHHRVERAENTNSEGILISKTHRIRVAKELLMFQIMKHAVNPVAQRRFDDSVVKQTEYAMRNICAEYIN